MSSLLECSGNPLDVAQALRDSGEPIPPAVASAAAVWLVRNSSDPSSAESSALERIGRTRRGDPTARVSVPDQGGAVSLVDWRED
jgi:hypothetical protein